MPFLTHKYQKRHFVQLELMTRIELVNLLITNEVLYRLSYISKWRPG